MEYRKVYNTKRCSGKLNNEKSVEISTLFKLYGKILRIVKNEQNEVEECLK